jgi:Spy/CpxP family protein refolding chaperone
MPLVVVSCRRRASLDGRRRQWQKSGAWALAVVMTIAMSTRLLGASERTFWWRDPDIQSELRLTDRQVRELDSLFAERLNERIALHQKLDRLETRFRQALERKDSSELLIEKLHAEVLRLRVARNARRTMMLLAMYNVLTPEQRARIRVLRRDAAENRNDTR